MKEFAIRIANTNDYSKIIGLINEFALFQKTPEKVTITAEQMKNDGQLFQCMIAETIAKNIIGFVTYFPVYFSWSGKAMYVDDLFVKEDFRKKGIGKELLNAVMKVAKEKDCKKVRWQVSDWNTNAIKFYKNLGAEMNDTERNCDLLL